MVSASVAPALLKAGSRGARPAADSRGEGEEDAGGFAYPGRYSESLFSARKSRCQLTDSALTRFERLSTEPLIAPTGQAGIVGTWGSLKAVFEHRQLLNLLVRRDIRLGTKTAPSAWCGR